MPGMSEFHPLALRFASAMQALPPAAPSVGSDGGSWLDELWRWRDGRTAALCDRQEGSLEGVQDEGRGHTRLGRIPTRGQQLRGTEERGVVAVDPARIARVARVEGVPAAGRALVEA